MNTFILLRTEPDHDQMWRFDTIVIILVCVQKQKESYRGIDFD